MITKLKLENLDNESIYKYDDDELRDIMKKYKEERPGKPITISNVEEWLDGTGRYDPPFLSQLINLLTRKGYFKL